MLGVATYWPIDWSRNEHFGTSGVLLVLAAGLVCSAGNTARGWSIVCRLVSCLWLWPFGRSLWSPLVGLSSLSIVSFTQSIQMTSLKIQIQHYTVDHLAQGSMKNGANSEMPCELQDTWTSTLWTHIAEISSSCFHTWLRVGLTSIKQLAVLHWAVTVHLYCAALRFADWVYSLSTLGISILGC